MVELFQIRAKRAELSPENSVHATAWATPGQNENDYCQKSPVVAWSCGTDAFRQYSALVLIITLLRVIF